MLLKLSALIKSVIGIVAAKNEGKEHQNNNFSIGQDFILLTNHTKQ